MLDLVARSLPEPVFGPLTGSVPAGHRQQLVDRFSSARHGAALVAQIVAGGVGLNIQSASAVVICEPQLKPTTEAQAIARAHRMGQVQSVQVHRLLSEDSVDQRITELLAGKKRLFKDFAGSATWLTPLLRQWTRPRLDSSVRSWPLSANASFSAPLPRPESLIAPRMFLADGLGDGAKRSGVDGSFVP